MRLSDGYKYALLRFSSAVLAELEVDDGQLGVSTAFCRYGFTFSDVMTLNGFIQQMF